MEKIIGSILLVLGLGAIGYALFSSFQVFTGSTEPPQLFSVSLEEQVGSIEEGRTPSSPEEVQRQIEGVIGEQLRGVLPVESIPQILNLSAWSLFAGLLLFGGGQVAGIGIKLLRKA